LIARLISKTGKHRNQTQMQDKAKSKLKINKYSKINPYIGLALYNIEKQTSTTIKIKKIIIPSYRESIPFAQETL